MALNPPTRHTATPSAYDALAHLPLDVDGYELERSEHPTSSGWTRVTTTIVLHGDGLTGRGEDVTYDDQDHDALAAAPFLPLADDALTFDGFSTVLDRLELFPRPPLREASRHFRRWAFESAALDLALRQAGLSLGEALGRSYQPVRFVVSTRLDARRWLELSTTIELKLDPTPEWTDNYIDALAASHRVRVLDMKGHNVGGKVCQPPNPGLYHTIATRFPDAIIEDPMLTPATLAALGPARDRVSWDAPIHSLAAVDALPFSPRYLNIKPSRFGTLAKLLECIEACTQRGITLYGGGQYELGAGRAQIQTLASLYYPNAPNDTAPTTYNDPEPRTGLPTSPLPPIQNQVGFC